MVDIFCIITSDFWSNFSGTLVPTLSREKSTEAAKLSWSFVYIDEKGQVRALP